MSIDVDEGHTQQVRQHTAAAVAVRHGQRHTHYGIDIERTYPLHGVMGTGDQTGNTNSIGTNVSNGEALDTAAQYQTIVGAWADTIAARLTSAQRNPAQHTALQHTTRHQYKLQCRPARLRTCMADVSCRSAAQGRASMF